MMLTKENTVRNDETLIGLRAMEPAIKECGSVSNIAVTLDMVKATEKSYQLYVENLKQEQLKKWQKAIKKPEQVEKKRKLEEMKTVEGCIKNLRYLLRLLRKLWIELWVMFTKVARKLVVR